MSSAEKAHKTACELVQEIDKVNNQLLEWAKTVLPNYDEEKMKAIMAETDEQFRMRHALDMLDKACKATDNLKCNG